MSPLDPSLLYVFVAGPGVGEAIAIRVPSDDWLVVDSCRTAGTNVPVNLISTYGGQCRAVILTHPHEDHSSGFTAILKLSSDSIVGSTTPPIVHHRSWWESTDPSTHATGSEAAKACAAIFDAWQVAPQRKLELQVGSRFNIGDADVLVIHPDEDTLAIQAGLGKKDLNRISAALSIQWNDVNLILGGDVHALDLDAVASRGLQIDRHHFYKVAHHGSIHSATPSIGGSPGARDRMWIVTPYSPARLPRLDDGDGVEDALTVVDELHVTGLSDPTQVPTSAPFRGLRPEIAAGKHRASARTLPGGIQVRKRAAKTATDHIVCVGFSPDGMVQDVRYGNGTVAIRER